MPLPIYHSKVCSTYVFISTVEINKILKYRPENEVIKTYQSWYPNVDNKPVKHLDNVGCVCV